MTCLAKSIRSEWSGNPLICETHRLYANVQSITDLSTPVDRPKTPSSVGVVARMYCVVCVWCGVCVCVRIYIRLLSERVLSVQEMSGEQNVLSVN